jgi:hypothetical protein
MVSHGVCICGPDAHPFADRALVGPKVLGQLAIHHYHQLRTHPVRIVKSERKGAPHEDPLWMS